MKSIINKTIISIEETTELFYQQKIEIGYEELDNTLMMISQSINSILNNQKEENERSTYESQLLQSLNEAMSALECKDMILFSDILQYDIKEIFLKALLSL